MHARRGLRIAYVSQYFPPEPAAPAARVYELSRAWVSAGDSVTVLTAFPNHPTGMVPAAYRGRWRSEEQSAGIRVLRSWILARPNAGVQNRTLSSVSFMISVLINGLVRGRHADVVIASSPPLFLGISAWLLARARGARFVLEVRDLWPEAFADMGVLRPGRTVQAIAALASFLYQRADSVVVVTHAFADRLAAQGVPRRKLIVLPNGADTRLFAPGVDGAPARSRLAPGSTFLVTYVGSHGLSQGLDAILDAAALQPDVTYLLVGDGADRQRLLAERERRGLVNVHLQPSVPRAEVPEIYAASDVCLVPLRDVPVFDAFVPSKIFEIMAAGRPLVGAVKGEAQSILESSRGALVVPPGDGRAIARAVQRLREDPALREELSLRGRSFALEHYDRERLAEGYRQVLANLVDP